MAVEEEAEAAATIHPVVDPEAIASIRTTTNCRRRAGFLTFHIRSVEVPPFLVR